MTSLAEVVTVEIHLAASLSESWCRACWLSVTLLWLKGRLESNRTIVKVIFNIFACSAVTPLYVCCGYATYWQQHQCFTIHNRSNLTHVCLCDVFVFVCSYATATAWTTRRSGSWSSSVTNGNGRTWAVAMCVRSPWRWPGRSANR